MPARRARGKNYYMNELRKAEKRGDQAAINYWQAQVTRYESGIRLPTSYTVKAGDSAAKIAEELYGDQRAAFDLMAANPDVFYYDPATGAWNTTVQPGQTLDVPQGDVGKAYVAPGTRLGSAGPRGSYNVTTFSNELETGENVQPYAPSGAQQPPVTGYGSDRAQYYGGVQDPNRESAANVPAGFTPAGDYAGGGDLAGNPYIATSPGGRSAFGQPGGREIGSARTAGYQAEPGFITTAPAPVYSSGLPTLPSIPSPVDALPTIPAPGSPQPGVGAPGPGAPYDIPSPIGPTAPAGGGRSATTETATAPTAQAPATTYEQTVTQTAAQINAAAELGDRSALPLYIENSVAMGLFGEYGYADVNSFMEGELDYRREGDMWVRNERAVNTGATPGGYAGYFYIPYPYNYQGGKVRGGRRGGRRRGGGGGGNNGGYGSQSGISNWRIGF